MRVFPGRSLVSELDLPGVTQTSVVKKNGVST